jgi:hypothetical protein
MMAPWSVTSVKEVPVASEAEQKAIDEGRIEVYGEELSRTEKKTEFQVLGERYCLGQGDHPEYTDLRESFGENFNQEIMRHLHDKISNNKKYYLSMANNRKLVYFRLEGTYYVQLLSVSSGQEEIIARYFTTDEMGGCIKSLPDSCKFQGNQQVTYEKKCRAGKNVGKGLIQDLVNVATSATEEQVSFQELMTAFQECYKPMCYNIEFDCLKYSLNYDSADILKQLEEIAAGISAEHEHLNAYVDPTTMMIKYSGTVLSSTQGVDLSNSRTPPQ